MEPGQLVWAPNSSRRDLLWPGVLIDPEEHAPDYVRNQKQPGRTVVCFYGPSIAQVGGVNSAVRVGTSWCLALRVRQRTDDEHVVFAAQQSRARDYAWVTAPLQPLAELGLAAVSVPGCNRSGGPALEHAQPEQRVFICQ